MARKKGTPNKIQSFHTSTGAYKFYRKLIGAYGKHSKDPLYDVDKAIYKEICEMFNKKIIQYVVKESGEFTLPARLGSLRIRKSKTPTKKRKMIRNWPETRRLGHNVYYTNEHSNGWFMEYFWGRRCCRVSNSSYYSLIIPHSGKKTLSNEIYNNPNIDYFE